jgi:squalene-hopene/tetraprenyl-beta-curcumene cyclase
MIDLNKIRFRHLGHHFLLLKEALNNYIDQSVKISGSLQQVVFSPSFFHSEFYLAFPYLFKKAFAERNESFSQQLCISGFLYFKYLLSLDDLIDNDSGDEKKEPAAFSLLRSHIYHEESLKILAKYFGNNTLFWKYWNQRNNEFLKSVLLDKEYNPSMAFDQYKMLCTTKCSFSKVAVDAMFCRHPQGVSLYNDLIQSIDNFSIARCIQDDLEDFKKDFVHKKNNLGHILLSQWLKTNGKDFQDQSIDLLEKYLYTSETAEKMLSLSKEYYQKAIDNVAPYREKLTDYIQTLELLRNNVNYFKVNIQAYRLDKYVKRFNDQSNFSNVSLPSAIDLSRQYIANLQHPDGSWFEISNKQGLSNVWATGFIGSFLAPNDECLLRAKDFLINNMQGPLWGYNTDWVYDFDSTTCVLLSLAKVKKSVSPFLREWFKGQTKSGGFSTYYHEGNTLFSNLGLKKQDVKGWVGSHPCVSALAYYFVNSLPDHSEFNTEQNALKEYILANQTRKGIWQPYWWTSYIYPTCFTVQAMSMESDDFSARINKAVDFMMRHQNEDGSYSCEVLKKPSAFYTALVLDTVCSNGDLYIRNADAAKKMQQWLLGKQYSNGRFDGTDFLVIPNPNVINWKPSTQNYEIKKNGGSNSITGEVANLFSTAVAQRALERYQSLN